MEKIEFTRHIPFIEHLGIEIEASGEGTSTLRLDVRPEQMNSMQMAHGGVLMTLLDVCMAQAARSLARHQGDEDHGVITIEMKATFIQAATGERVIARGNCLHRSGSMSFCEGELHDEHGRLLARGSGTFKYARAKPPARPDEPAKAAGQAKQTKHAKAKG